MRFENVSILGLAYEDAPHRISSEELEAQLSPLLLRFGLAVDHIRRRTGILARRFWDPGMPPSMAATMAARKVLTQTGIDPSRIGALVNTSVCKDFIEPSVASIVHANLRLSPHCLNFDVGNACLAFLTAMGIVGNMIERGQIESALIVDGEGSRNVIESTMRRLLAPGCAPETFRDNFATLTLGSGAAAMVLTRADLAPRGHRFLGGITVAATEFHNLCQGQVDEMKTDALALLGAGLELARTTFSRARGVLGWSLEALAQFVLHQVSAVHTAKLIEVLGLDAAKVHAIYPEFGNIGPASLPITLAKAVEAGRVKAGDRVALMGIGSGLNCAMMEVVW